MRVVPTAAELPGEPARPHARTATLVLGFAAVYVVVAELGLSLAFVAEQVTVVWPPTGLAIAILLLFGLRLWPSVALGAFVANLVAAAPPATAAGIALGNTLEAVVAAWALGRVELRPALDRLRDAVALIALAAGLATMLSATIGVASLCAGGVEPWGRFASLWRVWWLGDATGAVVVAPLLLAWSVVRRDGLDRRQSVELGAILAATLVLVVAVFAEDASVGLQRSGLHYVVFPLVVLGALRVGQPATTAATFVTSVVAIWGTVRGDGPFAVESVHESLVMLQLFLGMVAVTGMLLSAAIAERDAAEARRAADLAALETSGARLRLALEAGRLGVWDWNIRSGKVEWSDNLEMLHGLAPGGFPGTFAGFEELVHPEDRERVAMTIRDALADRSGYELDMRVVWPDGSIHWLAAKARVLRDADGAPLRLLGTAVDVTERRALEAESAARADQLAESDLRKDEFLAMLAHELRNPLAPLDASLRLLRQGSGDRETVLALADRQVALLVRLVDDLLDISRITRGTVTLRREPVALADVVARAVEVATPAALERQLDLTVDVPPTALVVDADPVRLVQVLANLLGNAVKYTPAGGTIAVVVEAAGDQVVVRVRDTGVGLSAELRPRVFDLFVQGDASLARTSGGLGIGLTLVRSLVELHGGRVEAHSAGPGQGSEFVVRLPLSSRSAGATRTPPAHAAGNDDGRDDGQGRGVRVLIVEDREDAAESLAMLLEVAGHTVRTAPDGLSALDAATEFVPDVVLSDLGLPGIDGFEVARRLRARGPECPPLLIAISGYGRDDDRQRSRAAGFDHHLVKPPDAEVLMALLSSAKRVGHGDGAAVPPNP